MADTKSYHVYLTNLLQQTCAFCGPQSGICQMMAAEQWLMFIQTEALRVYGPGDALYWSAGVCLNCCRNCITCYSGINTWHQLWNHQCIQEAQQHPTQLTTEDATCNVISAPKVNAPKPSKVQGHTRNMSTNNQNKNNATPRTITAAHVLQTMKMQ